MGIYSDAPGVHTFAEVKPTLLVCWWMTFFCLVIILLRIAGRFIRSEQLFAEDRTVGFAIIPLFLRMGCVHAILIFGTNNVDFGSLQPSEKDLHRRAIASGLVIASRVLHAATLWVFKITVLEFFKRISDAVSESFSDVAIKVIRGLLLATFIAVVISDLAECQPFDHYWQVLPDPGGKCRQGFAQLLTVTACNVITDLLLVLLPIRIIIQSRQTLKRKIQLSLLFSLSLAVVGVTIYRATRVIQEHGNQTLRTLLASVEIFVATAAANSLVLGSFVRDRGTKKNKYRNNSTAESIEHASANRSRRPTAHRHWGSDEDLVRGLGLGVDRSLREAPDNHLTADGMFTGTGTPALRVDDTTTGDGHVLQENATKAYSPNNPNNPNGPNGPNGPNSIHYHSGETGVQDLDSWQFPDRRRSGATNSARSGQSGMSIISGQSDDDALLRGPLSPVTRTNSASARRVSFYETGMPGELEGDYHQNTPPAGLRPQASRPVNEQRPPSPAYTASSRGLQRGSTALLSDLSGFLGPPTRHRPPRPDVRSSNLQTVPQGTEASLSSRPSPPNSNSPDDYLDGMNLIDAGGLLK